MKKLLRAVLVSYFGAGAARPRQAVWWRLLGMLLLAVSGSFYGVRLVADMPLEPWSHAATASLYLTAITQLATIVSLASIRSIADKHTTINALLIFLPLNQSLAWVLSMIPNFLLSTLILVLIGPGMVVGAVAIGVPTTWACITIIVGSISGLGFSMLFLLRLRWLKQCVILLFLGIEIIALRQLHNSYGSDVATILCTSLICLGMIGGVMGLLASKKYFIQEWNTPNIVTIVQPIRHSWAWLTAKSLRNKGMRLSLVSALILSSVSAFGIHRSAIQDPAMIATIAALIATASASDIRMMSRKYNPAEICALRGTFGYVLCTLQPFVLCMLACSPLLFLLGQQQLTTLQLALYGAYYLTGVTTGHAIGHLLAPQSKDISAQFFAVFTSACILWVPFRVQIFTTAQPHYQLLVFMLLCATLAGISVVAEYKRNPYRWRNKDV